MKKLSFLLFCGLLFAANLNAQTWNIGSPIASSVTATMHNDTLTISGTGAMADYSFIYGGTPYGSSAPWWSSYHNSLSVVIIENGVTTIGYAAFYNCIALTSVTIPNSVEIITDYAFSLCSNLTSVIIPNSVTTIKNYAFGSTALTFIIIPNSVETIGTFAFQNSTALTSIEVEADNPNFSSVDGVLFNKDQTTLIAYPAGKQGAYTIPNGVTTIGGYAFYRSGLISVIIPNSVTTIRSGAFSGCTALTSITSLNPVPPAVSANTFTSVNRELCTLYVVSDEALALYQAANIWKDFLNMQVIDQSAIEMVEIAGTGIMIFPNPAKDEIFIKSELQINNVEICSLTGSLLLSENNFSEKISVSTLPKGVYLLKSYTDKGLITRKIVKD